MTALRRRGGFTLIELLVVILILAVLMAIALPLYLRAVRDSNRQTCRSNMQTIANALQAYKVRSAPHLYPLQVLGQAGGPYTLEALNQGADPDFYGPAETAGTDLTAAPRCPTDDGANKNDDYTVQYSADGTVTIKCNASNGDADFHNTVGNDTTHGFTPGVDSQ
jgi:prepilin-type N-terminal cleavage/methylation domain-containing protein